MMQSLLATTSALHAPCRPKSSMPSLGLSMTGSDTIRLLPPLSVAPSRTARRQRRSLRTEAVFDFLKPKAKKAAGALAQRETVVPTPSYNLPLALGAIAAFSAVEGNAAVAALVAALGGFLALQASRVRFKFGADALEVVIGEGANEKDSGENAFVGGANRWKYDTFTNWEFWWPNFPVLVYFKETQTKPEGQIHFFPILFDARTLYKVMVERCGESQNSAPKEALSD